MRSLEPELAESARVQAAYAALRAADRDGSAPSYQARQGSLRALGSVIRRRLPDLVAAAAADFGEIDDGHFRLGKRTPDNGHVGNVSVFDRAVGLRDSSGKRKFLRVRDRSRLSHRTDDVNLWRDRWRQINEVIGFKVNVLRKVSMIYQSVKVYG